MNHSINMIAIADYLANATDRDSDEEMTSFLVEEFSLPENIAKAIVENWIKQFGTKPIIMEDDALKFLEFYLR